MSMIHDALKSMDTPSVSASPIAAHPSAITVARPVWVGGVVALASVLGAAGVGWMWWQNQVAINSIKTLPAATVVAPAPMQALPPPAVSLPAVVTTEPVASTAPVATVGQPPSTPLTGALAKQTPPTPAAVAQMALHPRADTPPIVATTHTTPRGSASKNTSTGTTLPSDDTPVELRFARFVSAMKSGQPADAENELIALRKHLPAETLGLMRAQAWFDLQAGRDVSAAQAYHAILERIPGDEEAAINLATIQLRQQQTEQARATLDTAIRLQPDSAALRNALGNFTPNARHDR